MNKLRYILLFGACSFLLAGFTFPAEEMHVNEKNGTVQTEGGQDERKTVSGVVVDESGSPIPGVTVLIKGTSLGTATDVDGKYSLSLPEGRHVLRFTSMGFTPVELYSDSKSIAKVVLKEETTEIDEVVITGYQKIDRKLFTGAASVVRADQLESDGANDISRMLQGKAAGVAIQNVSGTFGAAPKMKIRGSSSIFGEMKPLWVIDGVVLEDVVEISADELSSGDATTLISSAVAGLNSDDIESFQILKDASATALYGARAMNGVIVITTKKGRKGQMKLNYSGEFSMRQVPTYREYNIMNSQQQMGVYLDMEAKGWLDYMDLMNGSNGGVYRIMYEKISSVLPDGS